MWLQHAHSRSCESVPLVDGFRSTSVSSPTTRTPAPLVDGFLLPQVVLIFKRPWLGLWHDAQRHIGRLVGELSLVLCRLGRDRL